MPTARKDPARGVQGTKTFVRRLLEEQLARRQGDPAEITELLGLVEGARTLGDLNAISSRLLTVIGVEPRLRGSVERRTHSRKSCSLMLRILEDGSHGMHFIRDISTGGLSLYIQAPLPLFPELHCQLPLYHQDRTFCFTARVIWCQPDPPPVVGLEYAEIGEDALDWIRGFLAS